MKKVLILAMSILTVAALAGAGLAAEMAPAPAPPKPAHAGKMIPHRMMTGEVTAVTTGKNVSIKDEKGRTHRFTISGATKIDGELKVGAKVEVTSKGRAAEAVKVQG